MTYAPDTVADCMGKQRQTPEVGMIFKVYGQDCRITRVLPAGTIDVVTLDGSHNYRVTGLPFTVTP